MQYEELRTRMVQDLKERGINDTRVLSAFSRVERHELVPEAYQHQAYEDSPLPIGRDQTISQPYMVALMTDLLGVREGDRVLEVGTGSGYQAAILSEMGADVTSIESYPELAEEARGRLKRLGYDVDVIAGDGSKGHAEGAPYDRIIVTAGAPSVPKPLQDQLKDGGVLVIPTGRRRDQVLLKIVRKGDKFEVEESVNCVFVPLTGEYGW